MKRLVVCCDGTWNKADQDSNGHPCPTNVVKLAYRVAKRDGATPQIVFYDQGVGTGNVLDRWSGGALGEGLDDNIFDAYRFLIANYEMGDEIYLFGFSRGAFTARSIAGMIRKCGIVKRTSIAQYAPAMHLYRDYSTHPDAPAAKAFKQAHSCSPDDDVPIHFIGVWDTVGSLGIPLRGLRWITRRKHVFHDTELSKTVTTARHALAIDERRAPFEPTLWMEKPKPGQTLEQVWFPGVHSDVGGGYAEADLSDIALDWMLGEAKAAGLALDADVVMGRPLQPNSNGKLHDSKNGLYNLTPGIDRTIGVGGSQRVHSSAIARWDNDRKYRPKNLRAYFKATGDRRADA
ncbi:MAG: DUF2235 domain-containing protein [Gemmatimonadaceae bacterium]